MRTGTPQPYQVSAEQFDGLTAAEAADLRELLRVWNDKLGGNSRNVRYYKGRNRLKDLGIAIPPALTGMNVTVGWPAKAVDALAVRSVFEGVSTGTSDDAWLSKVLRDNDFALSYSQAVTSELIGSCAFATVSSGVGDEPEVLINFYSPLTSSALWDVRRKCIRCGMTVSDYETRSDGVCEPLAVNYYTSGYVIKCEKTNGKWRTERVANPVGRPLMEPLRYRPSLERPFGKSRISKAVRDIADEAMRTVVRMEVSAELYTAPQRYLLGADENTFKSDDADERATKVRSYFGSIFAATTNENGDIPQYGQLAQMTMQPHMDMLQSLAMRFAGETGVPVSSLGVSHDNPMSAEALRAMSEDLVIEAEALNATNGASIENVARIALALRDGKTMRETVAGYPDLYADFRNPMRPTKAATTDSSQKEVAMFPWMAEEDGAVEILLAEQGYNKSQVAQLMKAKRSHDAQAALAEVLNVNEQAGSGSVPGAADGGEGGGRGGGREAAGNEAAA